MTKELFVLCFYGIASTLRSCGNTVAPFSAMLFMFLGVFLYSLAFMTLLPIPLPHLEEEYLLGIGLALFLGFSWFGKNLFSTSFFATVYRHRKQKNMIRVISSLWFLSSIAALFGSAFYSQ